ncbi:unnamed protein product [Penicillium bialowiezense]
MSQCDEKRPKCKKCEDRMQDCRYESSGSFHWTMPAAAEHSSTQYQEIMFQSNLSPSDMKLPQRNKEPSPVEVSAGTTGDRDNLHSRLLVHWKTATAPSISRNDPDLQIWQIFLPKEATSNPCLSHGIFAVSAIHIALLNPQDSDRELWIQVAEEHQSKAINLFTYLMQNKEESQQIGNFLLSSFAFAFPLAVSEPIHDMSDPLGEIIQIITLVKSTMSFSAPLLMHAKTEEMSRLTYVEDSSPSLSDSSRSAILSLYEVSNTQILNHDDRQAFQATIHLLEDLFANIDNGAEPVSKTFMWISELPSRFADLLDARHPFALVIFGHYCVVLHQLRWLWWISSWGHRLLHPISRTLESAWKPHIAWPLHMTDIEVSNL